MTRQEFHTLRDLPGKTINEDIVFRASASNSSGLTFSNVRLENELGWEIIVNGTFKPTVPTITFNFYVKNEGPICRVCVNGVFHDGTRTHKHELRHPQDQHPTLNLPTTIPRPDLEKKTPREVWEDLLRAAKITHNGNFIDPV